MGRRSYQPVNVGTANVNEDVKEVIEGTDESVRQIIDDSKNLALGDNLVSSSFYSKLLTILDFVLNSALF